MTERLPLVIIDGQVQELPSGDSIPGTGGSIIDPTGQKNKVLSSDGASLVFKGVNEVLAFPLGDYTIAKSSFLKDSLWSTSVNSTSPDNFYISGGVGMAYGVTANNYAEIKTLTPGFGATENFDIVLKTKVWHQVDTFLCQGVFVGNSSNKKLMGCLYYSGAGFGWQIWNGTAYSSEGYVTNSVTVPAAPTGNVIYWRIIKDATNIKFYASLTGLPTDPANWDLVGSHLTSILTEVTQVGVYTNNFDKTSTTTTNAGIALLGYDKGVQPVDNYTSAKTHRKIITTDYSMTTDDFYGGQIISGYGDVNVPAGITLTIPSGLDAKAPATIIQHRPNLPITFAAASGVTLIKGSATKTLKENAMVSIIPIASDVYFFTGGMV